MQPWYIRLNVLLAVAIAGGGFALSYYTTQEGTARLLVVLGGVALAALYLWLTSRSGSLNDKAGRPRS